MRTLVDQTQEQQNRIFENDSLLEVVKLAKKKGYNVYTFESSSKYITQVFIEDAKLGRLGTVQAYYSGIQFSTMHQSESGSGMGSGFGGLVDGDDFNNIEDIDICFITHPYWAIGRLAGNVYKFKSFSDYLNKSIGLKYYQI